MKGIRQGIRQYQPGVSAGALAILLCALAAGSCGGNGGGRPEESGGTPPAEPAGQGAAQPAEPVPPGTGSAVDPAPPAAPDAAEQADDPPDQTQAGWTSGSTRVDRTPTGVATLRSVRSASHPGFDRIVLDFGSDPLPSFRIEYIDRPVRQCGSGDTVPLAGDGWLSIHTEPARGHDDQGRATFTDRRRAPGHPNVRELVLTCDFEAHVEWVAGVLSPEPYRAFTLSAPTRLVVDVRRPRQSP